MPFFISKPVRIEARRFASRSFDHMQDLTGWVKQGPPVDQHTFHDGKHIFISTLEGVMRADVGDWIIKGTRGEFYPCKPDVFAVKYSAAPSEDAT